MSNRKYVTRINVEVDDRRQTAWMPVAASSIVWNSDAYKFIKNTTSGIKDKLEQVAEAVVYIEDKTESISNNLDTQIDRIDDLDSKVDSSVSSTNKLIGESQINEKISKSDAHFVGTYKSKSDIPSPAKHANDYAYALKTESTGTTRYYKYQPDEFLQWEEAYPITNNDLTYDQMNTLNSGASKDLIDATRVHVPNADIHVTKGEKDAWNSYATMFKPLQDPVISPDPADEVVTAFISSIAQDETGKISATSNKVAATKVIQSEITDDKNLPVLVSGEISSGLTELAKDVKYTSSVLINPNSQLLTATNLNVVADAEVNGQLLTKELNVINDALVQGDLTVKGKIVNKVGNDYAEYRLGIADAGRCVVETGDGDLVLSTDRLQPAANIVSDTFGFAIGETETHKLPIAVCGRALVYPFEDKNCYKAGDVVCSGPYGTVSIMSREEIINYPDRIVGIVSEIPKYEKWGASEVPVNGRIWIKIR